MTHILVVEDEPNLRQLLVDNLGFEGFTVEAVDDGVPALAAQRAHRADLIVLSDAQHRVVVEPRVFDIVCAAVVRCFHEDSVRQRDFADVDVEADAAGA